MPRFPQRLAAILLTVVGEFAIAPAVAAPTVATRQQAFLVPFEVEMPPGSNRSPREVRLYVSADQGGRWSLAQRQSPASKYFLFRAPRDGEYWFCVRTIDAAGQAQPPGPFAPELKVQVDTVAPRLDLQVMTDESGALLARFSAADPLLDADSLKIEYQTQGSGLRRPVAVDPPGGAANRTNISGETRWWCRAQDEKVLVYAWVSDRAGNSSVITRQVATRRPVTAAPDAGDPAGGPSDEDDRTLPQLNAPAGPAGRDPLRDARAADREAEARTIPWAANAITDDALALQNEPAGTPPGPFPRRGDVSAGRRSRADRTGRPIETRNPWQPRSSTQDLAGEPRRRPGIERFSSPRTTVGQSSGSRVDRTVGFERNSAGSSSVGNALPGSNVRISNRQQLDLEYDIDSVGPSGVERVELWVTRDGGSSWRSGGVDPDGRSPFTVQVPGEGVYGYRLAVTGGNGLADPPPQSGDDAELWVEIDWTLPETEITSARYGSGETAGHLEIQWRAADKNLGDRPVSLFYRGGAGQSWTPIATDTPNTGRYMWRVDSQVPRDIFLRLEVRDLAGNVGVHELSNPIPNDGLIPRGRIRGLRTGRDD